MVDKNNRGLTRSVAFQAYLQPSGAPRPPALPTRHPLALRAPAAAPRPRSQPIPALWERPCSFSWLHEHTKNFVRRGYHVARPVLTARGRASRRATLPRPRLSLARPPFTSARRHRRGLAEPSIAVIWRRAAAASKRVRLFGTRSLPLPITSPREAVCFHPRSERPRGEHLSKRRTRPL